MQSFTVKKGFSCQRLSLHDTFHSMKGPRNRLRVLRAEKEISQLDLATKARIKEYRYWRIENGYVIPTDDERDALARALKVTVLDVFPQPEAIAS
jgi:transcriptional regulator with XRE-family HTH domain